MDILYINDETIRLLILFSYKEQQLLPSIIDGLYFITLIYAGDIKHIYTWRFVLAIELLSDIKLKDNGSV